MVPVAALHSADLFHDQDQQLPKKYQGRPLVQINFQIDARQIKDKLTYVSFDLQY